MILPASNKQFNLIHFAVSCSTWIKSQQKIVKKRQIKQIKKMPSHHKNTLVSPMVGIVGNKARDCDEWVATTLLGGVWFVTVLDGGTKLAGRVT